jgi:hypothetical protein
MSADSPEFADSLVDRLGIPCGPNGSVFDQQELSVLLGLAIYAWMLAASFRFRSSQPSVPELRGGLGLRREEGAFPYALTGLPNGSKVPSQDGPGRINDSAHLGKADPDIEADDRIDQRWPGLRSYRRNLRWAPRVVDADPASMLLLGWHRLQMVCDDRASPLDVATVAWVGWNVRAADFWVQVWIVEGGHDYEIETQLSMVSIDACRPAHRSQPHKILP